jgi:hypothetical protein
MSSGADASAGVRRARERFQSAGWLSEDTPRPRCAGLVASIAIDSGGPSSENRNHSANGIT